MRPAIVLISLSLTLAACAPALHAGAFGPAELVRYSDAATATAAAAQAKPHRTHAAHTAAGISAGKRLQRPAWAR